ncbi:MAG: hypothetical protein V4649_10905 [Bacteroidota bacterium]
MTKLFARIYYDTIIVVGLYFVFLLHFRAKLFSLIFIQSADPYEYNKSQLALERLTGVTFYITVLFLAFMSIALAFSIEKHSINKWIHRIVLVFSVIMSIVATIAIQFQPAMAS